jgi:REP-associated tyrosine transposase
VGRNVRVSPGGVYGLRYHVVWWPKYRRPVLTDLVKDRCAELICARAGDHGRRIEALEIMPDHVHLFATAHRGDSPSYVVNQVKGFISRMLREEFAHLRSQLPTLWSRSYFTATAAAVPAATVRRYLGTQYERAWRTEGQR